jgi:hypothetical protein
LIDRIDRAGAPTLLLGALIAAAPLAMDIYHPSDGVDDRRHVALRSRAFGSRTASVRRSADDAAPAQVGNRVGSVAEVAEHGVGVLAEARAAAVESPGRCG